MDRSAASERVRALARRRGFELVGIATLSPASTGEAYRRWLARGDQAGMAWMERNRDLRADPRGLLPGARSAVVVGVRYAPKSAEAEPSRPADDLWWRVARYAHGRDYHEVLRERLGGLASDLTAVWPEMRSRICVDTAPLLERELAARAGLGAVGKNTNLLSPEFGSWFVLGELLTDLDLAPDPPIADLCGSCSRCLEACPTGALPEPYRLDARRCIAYWTIEHRGEIDPAIRPHVAERLFGCDICQEVCPWNGPIGSTGDSAFEIGTDSPRLDPLALLEIDPDGFRQLFRGTSLARARRDGLRRNAAYALAGSRKPEEVEALARAAAQSGSPVVSAAAAWASKQRSVGEEKE